MTNKNAETGRENKTPGEVILPMAIVIPVLLTALLATTLTLGAGQSVSTGKTEYELGEPVTILITDIPRGARLIISDGTNAYRYLGELETKISFTPSSVGEYLLDFQSIEGSSIDTAIFQVRHAGSIILEKTEYFKGDIVEFAVSADNKSSIRILKGEKIYKYKGDLKSNYEFNPSETGEYEIQLQRLGEILESVFFKVSEATSPSTEEPSPIPPLVASDTNTTKRGKKKPELRAGRASFEAEEQPWFRLEVLDKEVLKARGKWKQEYEKYEKEFKQGNYRRDVLKTENQTVRAKVYDKSGREVNVKTEIAELREGLFDIRLEKPRQFRAGKYKIFVTLENNGNKTEQEQDFLWGVLAINTHKATYLEGEEAFIGMAVLDDNGNMVCDANVTLEITDPSNQTTVLSTDNNLINISPECKFLGVTNLPDYYTSYRTGTRGEYQLKLGAYTSNGYREISDSFWVRKSVDFDVERSGPTRIYPLVPYQMNFTIISSNGYTGRIREYVPRSFQVFPQGGMSISIVGDTKVLQWQENLEPGEQKYLSYTFDAPDISPQFYVLGPLETGSWQEARQWQIASDAVIEPVFAQNCSAEDEAAKGSFGSTCDGTYPAACGAGGDLLSCNDGNSETHTAKANSYGGVRIESHNSSETECSSITTVEMCYEWWSDRGNLGDCDISVDNDGDTSWQAVTSTCPGTSSDPGLTCTDVTSLEDWTCGNFFGSTGTRARIKSEVDKSANQGGTATISWDALYYKVTYQLLQAPIVTLNDPSNNTVEESSTVDFKFTATDEKNTTLNNCTLYGNFTGSWQENKTTTGVQNNTETNITINLVDGAYLWNVQCFDHEGESDFGNSNYTVKVNSEPPQMSDQALNTTVINQSEQIRFNVSITDVFGIDAALVTLLFPNGTKTNYTLTQSGDEFSTILSDTTQLGTYNITLIWANDTLGKIGKNQTPLLSFEVTPSPPGVFELLLPLNSTESTNLKPNLSWEQTSEPDFLNYTILIDKDPEFTSPDFTYYNTPIDNTSRIVDFALDANSVYYWQVIAYDTFLNSRNSTNKFTYITDTINPSITLNTPTDNSHVTSSSVTFNYTPTDTNTVDTCTLYGNFTGSWAANESSSTITKDIPNLLTTNLGEGSYRWNVRCNDSAGNSAFASNNFTVTVDLTGPQVQLISPENNTVENTTNNVVFVANATDTFAGVDSCELIVDGVSKQTKSPITEGAHFNYTQFLNNGNYTWRVNCTDTNGLESSLETYNLTVTVIDSDPPLIDLNSPSANSFVSESDISFNYTPQDATGIQNCSIYLNSILNQTCGIGYPCSVANQEWNVFNNSGILDGFHEWNITCFDNSTDFNKGVSETRNFTVDTIFPAVFSLTSPPNGTEPEKVIKKNDTWLNWSQTTELNFLNYTITLDTNSDFSSPEYIFNTFEIDNVSYYASFLADNIYYWKVTAYDKALNSRETETWAFRINAKSPNFTATSATPESPATYNPAQVYVFNATLEEFALDGLLFQNNFSGVLQNSTDIQNWTPDNHTHYVNITFTGLAAGNYEYRWYANDTEGSWGSTSAFTYIINKAASEINLLLNGTDGNNSVSEDQFVNITARLLTPDIGGYIEIYQDGALINNGSAPLTNNSFFAEPGSYNITAVYPATQNYTEAKETHFLTVNDTTEPQVNALSPENSTTVGSNSVIFIYNVSDSSSILNCSIYIDGGLQETNTSVTKNINQTFALTLADGNYTWQVGCFDYSLNQGFSEIFNLTVIDSSSIKLAFSANKADYEQGEIANLTINTKDVFGNNIDTNSTLDIIKGVTTRAWWNSSWKMRKPIVMNETQGVNQTNALAEVNISGLNGAISSCIDEIRIIENNGTQLSEIPVEIVQGDNNNWCLAYFRANLTANAVNSNNYYVYYNNSGATNPGYNVQIQDNLLFVAHQASADEGTPTGVSNIVGNDDATSADITVTGGGSQQESAHGRGLINYTPEDEVNEVRVRYRYEVPIVGATGQWQLRHSVDDGAGYSNSFSGTSTQTKQTSNWNDITSLYAALNWSELNRTRLQGRTTKGGGSDTTTLNLFWVEMNVTVDLARTINQTSVDSQEVLITQVKNNTGIDGTWIYEFDTQDHELTNYSAVAIASRETFNSSINSVGFEIVPDATPPNVTLLSPPDLQEAGVGEFEFIYRPFDINLDSCTLYYGKNGNFNPNETDSAPINNQNNSFASISLGLGVYQWNVLCNDTWGNSGFAPSNFTLNITGPDLVVKTENISFSNETKIEGRNITIFANISNVGLSNANSSFIVQFFKGDPDTGGTQINGNKTIPELNQSLTVTVNTSYILDSGINQIFILIDPDNKIEESDESNNKANNNISVPLYQTMYGNVSSDIILADTFNRSLVSFENITNNKGNIFVADTDSAFSFADLQAITRNTNGDSVGNDFTDIDTNLNTTDLNDSVKKTWGGGTDTPIETEKFTIGLTDINNVPVVNSTNTSTFITGIMWDTTDDSSSNLQYDTTDDEDIVFITKINSSKQGRYGTYDYEIKVPALLREYTGAVNKLTFYYELK